MYGGSKEPGSRTASACDAGACNERELDRPSMALTVLEKRGNSWVRRYELLRWSSIALVTCKSEFGGISKEF